MTDPIPFQQRGQEHAPHLAQLPIRDILIGYKSKIPHIRGLAGAKWTAIPDEYWDQLQNLTFIASAEIDKNQGKTDSVHINFDKVDFRASIITGEIEDYLHIRRHLPSVPGLDELGFTAAQIETLDSLGQRQGGLVLISGAAGEGKTTTACALIQHWITQYPGLARTCEDPVEVRLEGDRGPGHICIQTTVSKDNFAEEMHKILRHGPRYILISEIRTGEQAHHAILAANTGHIVVSTVHAPGIVQTIQRLIDLGAENNNRPPLTSVAAGLLAIIHQRLEFNPTRTIANIFALSDSTGDAIRSLIRQNLIEQISSHVERQERLLGRTRPNP